jgi:peptidoglycan/LPS O-acetylase OafA/YrhL
MFQTYGKAIVAAVYAVLAAALPLFFGDHHIDPSEGVAIGIAICAALLTYLVPLVPGARWAKTAVGAVLAGLQVAATVIVGGVDSNDLMMIALAVISFLGIAVAPAVSNVGTPVPGGTSSR